MQLFFLPTSFFSIRRRFSSMNTKSMIVLRRYVDVIRHLLKQLPLLRWGRRHRFCLLSCLNPVTYKSRSHSSSIESPRHRLTVRDPSIRTMNSYLAGQLLRSAWIKMSLKRQHFPFLPRSRDWYRRRPLNTPYVLGTEQWVQSVGHASKIRPTPAISSFLNRIHI